jgi:hypothetical protein
MDEIVIHVIQHDRSVSHHPAVDDVVADDRNLLDVAACLMPDRPLGKAGKGKM